MTPLISPTKAVKRDPYPVDTSDGSEALTVLPQEGTIALLGNIVADLHFDFGKLNIQVDIKRLHLLQIEFCLPA